MNEIIFFCKVFLIIKILKKAYTQKDFSFEEYAELAIMIRDAIHDMPDIS